MNGFVDHIAGADSDSGYVLEVRLCPCETPHRVALTRLDGRFAFNCGGREFSGQLDAESFRQMRAHMNEAHDES